LERGSFTNAARDFQRGLNSIQGYPFCGDVVAKLQQDLQSAKRGVFREELRRFIDEIQYLYGDEHASRVHLQAVDSKCAEIWAHREDILRVEEASPRIGESPGRDLLDLALVWTDVQVRLAPSDQRTQAYAHAAAILRSVEEVEGGSPVLKHELKKYSSGSADKIMEGSPTTPRSAWECYALGRSLMQSGDLASADSLFDEAIRLGPSEFWPWFCRGVCSLRQGKYSVAKEAFTVAIALRPQSAECYYNRAQAYASSGDVGKARQDYDQAISLNPSLASAVFNRGVLHLTQKELSDAERDFRRALELGMEPSAVQYNLALMHLQRKDLDLARQAVEASLHHRPGLKPAIDLKAQIQRQK
jgi:Flp pilus assembly protein TadD